MFASGQKALDEPQRILLHDREQGLDAIWLGVGRALGPLANGPDEAADGIWHPLPALPGMFVLHEARRRGIAVVVLDVESVVAVEGRVGVMAVVGMAHGRGILGIGRSAPARSSAADMDPVIDIPVRAACGLASFRISHERLVLVAAVAVNCTVMAIDHDV